MGKGGIATKYLQYKSLGNTVKKGEIAHNEQFSPFSTEFKKNLDFGYVIPGLFDEEL